jgi:hypothetical protein
MKKIFGFVTALAAAAVLMVPGTVCVNNPNRAGVG